MLMAIHEVFHWEGSIFILITYINQHFLLGDLDISCLFQLLKMERETKYFYLHVLSVCWCCITMWKQKCCSRGTAVWKGTCSLSRVQTHRLHQLMTSSRYLCEPCKKTQKEIFIFTCSSKLADSFWFGAWMLVCLEAVSTCLVYPI